MYYWSRWTNISTTETRTDEARESQASWRDTAPRLAVQRETRPVIAIPRNRTQPLSAPSVHQRERGQKRTTASSVSLDVQRSPYPTRSTARGYTQAGWQPEATTQPVIEAFRLK